MKKINPLLSASTFQSFTDDLVRHCFRGNKFNSSQLVTLIQGLLKFSEPEDTQLSQFISQYYSFTVLNTKEDSPLRICLDHSFFASASVLIAKGELVSPEYFNHLCEITSNSSYFNALMTIIADLSMQDINLLVGDEGPGDQFIAYVVQFAIQQDVVGYAPLISQLQRYQAGYIYTKDIAKVAHLPNQYMSHSNEKEQQLVHLAREHPSAVTLLIRRFPRLMTIKPMLQWVVRHSPDLMLMHSDKVTQWATNQKRLMSLEKFAKKIVNLSEKKVFNENSSCVKIFQYLGVKELSQVAQVSKQASINNGYREIFNGGRYRPYLEFARAQHQVLADKRPNDIDQRSKPAECVIL